MHVSAKKRTKARNEEKKKRKSRAKWGKSLPRVAKGGKCRRNEGGTVTPSQKETLTNQEGST